MKREGLLWSFIANFKQGNCRFYSLITWLLCIMQNKNAVKYYLNILI